MSFLISIKNWALAALAVISAVLFALLQRSEKKQAKEKMKQAQADAQVSQALANELTKGEEKANEARTSPIHDDQFTKP